MSESGTKMLLSGPYDSSFKVWPRHLLKYVLMGLGGIDVNVSEDAPPDHRDFVTGLAVHRVVEHVLCLCEGGSQRRALELDLIQSNDSRVQKCVLGELDFSKDHYIAVEGGDVLIWSDQGRPYRCQEVIRIGAIFQPLITDRTDPEVRGLAFDRYIRFVRVALRTGNLLEDMDGLMIMESLVDMVEHELKRVVGRHGPIQARMVWNLLSIAIDPNLDPSLDVSPNKLLHYFLQYKPKTGQDVKRPEVLERIVEVINGFLYDSSHQFISLELMKGVIFDHSHESALLRGISPFSVEGIATVLKSEWPGDYSINLHDAYEDAIQIISDIIESDRPEVRRLVQAYGDKSAHDILTSIISQ